MTYTAITQPRLRNGGGSLAKKLATEFGLVATEISTYMVKTTPPALMKKVTNLYYDPATGELKFTAEA
jgi:hypothetical protein